MATKKANGEGSVGKYRNKWRGLITTGRDENGKLIRKAFYGNTKKEVLDQMAEYKTLLNKGILPSNDKITLEQWFFTWLFDFRINDLKPSTFERYDGIYRNYILGSELGKMKLTDIRAHHIQQFFNNLLENGRVDKKTNKKINITVDNVKTIKRYLSTCMNEATKQSLIIKNYTPNTKLPKIIKEDKITVLSSKEQASFLKAIDKNKYKTLFYLAIATGLRQGELLALKWSDIDFINNTVSVTKSIKKVTFIDKEGNRKGQVIEQTPKTESSNRIVPIPDNVMKILKSHQVKQKENIMKCRDIYNDMDYIFCNNLGDPIDSKTSTRNFQSVLKLLEIEKMPFHSLRHTYATRLFEAGVPIKTVQSLLGHSKMETTMNIYTHVMPEEKNKAANKINDLFAL